MRLSCCVARRSDLDGKRGRSTLETRTQHTPGRLAWLGYLLLLVTIGCQNTVPANVPAHSDTEARPAPRVYPPQNRSDYGANDERRGRRRSRRGRPEEQAAPGEFDFYLLNLSWSPEFCATHGDSPECGRNLALWCMVCGRRKTVATIRSIAAMPRTREPAGRHRHHPTASLVEHEWQTHGTCSGLGVDEYFRAMHKAYAAVKIPANIGQGSDADGVTPDDLLTRFAAANPGYPAGSFALSCGNNRLTAVEICLSKDLRPEACQGVRSCRANVVKVTPR